MSRFFDTKRSYRRTNSSSSIKPSLWLIRSRFRTFLEAIARATSRRTKSRRLLKTTHCLTFFFPTNNETLDPILLGLRTSSSCISLSMLKVPIGSFYNTSCIDIVMLFCLFVSSSIALGPRIVALRPLEEIMPGILAASKATSTVNTLSFPLKGYNSHFQNWRDQWCFCSY